MTASLPAPRVAPLRGGPVLRWGVLGPGEIANAFTRAIHEHTDQRVVAVASRAFERAAEFGIRHSVPRVHGSYADLVADDTVDIVYVAVPHPFHLPLALLAIRAGKHVLVEKPLAVTAAEADQIRSAAQIAGVFAGEAMWTRYLPQMSAVRQLIDRGDLGEIRSSTVDVGWATSPDPGSRFTDPGLAGGAVLDAGVYGVWFTRFVLGPLSEVRALGSIAPTGVEDQVAAVLRGARGRVGSVIMTIAGPTAGLASVTGTTGVLQFLDPFVFPARFVVRSGEREHEWRDESGLTQRDGLAWQATAVAQHIDDGLLDSPTHPLEGAISVLHVLDAIRAHVLGPSSDAEPDRVGRRA